MHCPNCGTEASAGQKFCRACGLSLDRFAQLLAELLLNREDKNEKSAVWTVGILFAVLSILMMMLGHIDVAVIVSLVGVGLAAILRSDNQSTLNKKVPRRSPSQPSLPSSETTNKLLSGDQPRIAMSVTEQTTAQLGEKIEPRH
jgi:zinc-ribbon domain